MIQIVQINAVINYTKITNIDIFCASGWMHKFAIQVLKYADDLEIVNIYFDATIKKAEYCNISSIKSIIFPVEIKSKFLNFASSVSFNEYVKNNQAKLPVVYVNHRPFSPLSLSFQRLFVNRNYIIMTHGEGNPRSSLKHNKLRFFRILAFLMEKRLLSNVKYYLAGSKTEVDTVGKKYLKLHIKLLKGGVNFEKFYWTEKPIYNSTITILYVGKFYKGKGVEELIKAVIKLRKKYDIKLICIGGNENEKFYPKVVQHADVFRLSVTEDEIIDYLSKTDIYVLPTKYKKRVHKLGGIGTAVIEALAMGIPVVSNNLEHFNNRSKINDIGIIPKNNLLGALEQMIVQYKKYDRLKIRELTRKYYDEKIVVMSFVNVCRKVSHLS